MKYNEPLVIKENDSLSMLLKYIRPYSKVLEFGCANGRMTKYMAEQLNCEVSIIEYEKEAYQDAVKFAADGLCTDIMQFEWCEYFQSSFDYIIFADVLEHLANPKEVLIKTHKLLKEDGKVLLSIPNIAHNDIIVKLIQGSFDYTDIGLLDDTHIHFFAKNGISKFLSISGYVAEKVEYTQIPIGQTEQFWNSQYKVDYILEDRLVNRIDGEIYQYIICARKKKESEKETNDLRIKRPIKVIQSKLYLDFGEGFSEQNTIYINAVWEEESSFRIKEKISFPKGVKKVRIDLVENQHCILKYCDIRIGEENVSLEYSPFLSEENKKLLLEPDPMIIVSHKKDEICFLNMDILFSISISEIMNFLSESMQRAERELEEKREEREKIEEIIKQKDIEIQNYIFDIEKINFTIQEKEKEVKKTTLDKQDLEEKYRILEKKFDKYIKEKIKELQEKTDEIKRAKEELTFDREEKKKLKEEINLLKEDNHKWKNKCIEMEESFSWRITKWLRNIIK